MKTIETKCGIVLLDDRDYERLQREKKYLIKKGGRLYVRKRGETNSNSLMRFITGKSSSGVLFKDGNSLNYTRQNLIIYFKDYEVTRYDNYVGVNTGRYIVFLDVEDYNRLLKEGDIKLLKHIDKIYIYYPGGTSVALTSFVVGDRTRNWGSFKDGNSLNCTKSNIVLGRERELMKSKYFGVVGYITNKGTKRYKTTIRLSEETKLHFGVYKDEIIAAIAYNKAIDILGKGGIKIRNKVPIDDIQYDKIYKELKIELNKNKKRQGINRKLEGCTSKYTGVSYAKQRGKWRSIIGFKGSQFSLGYYKDETKAAQAYNEAAIYLYGEEAKTNPVPDPMHSVIDLEKIRQKLEKKGITNNK